MSGWLSAYRAIDLTDERGLLAGQMLAKLGMDVIQVEPPTGSRARMVSPFDADGRSFYWSAYAAGKRGVTLDLNEPEGRALLLRLVEKADFLFESEEPGKLTAMGLDYASLRGHNPRLIHVSITPFGSVGPKAAYADSDLILWAAGGALYPSRDGSGPPVRISVPQAYLHGAADAASGALIAHFARVQSGLGQHVDISVQQSVTQATLAGHLAPAVGHRDYSYLPKPTPGPKPLDLSGSGARTRRSKWVVRDGLVELHLGLGPAGGGKTNNLFAWMNAEGALSAKFHDWDWRTLPDRIVNAEVSEDDIEEARGEVARFLAPYTKIELLEAAINKQILLAPVNDIGDLLASSHHRERGFFVKVEEDGASRTIPGAFAFGPGDMFAPARSAPMPGEHNVEVYRDLLDIDVATLERLAAERVI